MLELVTFVQLMPYWYEGFSQSVVMESDLLLREWGQIPQCCKEADCQHAEKKSDSSPMDACCGNIIKRPFFYLKM